MQTGCTLIFAIISIFWEGCYLEKMDVVHYRVVEGDYFKTPCCKEQLCKDGTCCKEQHCKDVTWTRYGGGHVQVCPSKDGTRQEEHGSGVISRDNILEFPAVKSTHSGNYTCLINGSGRRLLHLQVLEKANLSCHKSEESHVEIVLDRIGKIPCPIFNCSDYNTNVFWLYKGNWTITELNNQCGRDADSPNGDLIIPRVHSKDTGVYFCDRLTYEQGINWTNRRAVNVTVIPKDTRMAPTCILPQNNTEQEVDLGQPYTLYCKVQFGFEKNRPRVQWYGRNQDGEDCVVLNQSRQWKSRDITTGTATQNATIEEVTQQHLNCSYTCHASNKVGNCSATIRLKRKIRVNPVVVVFAIVPLLLVAGLGITVHIKWVEVTLLYRTYVLQTGNREHEKEFDAFVSFVWSTASKEIGGHLSMLSSPRPGFDDQTTPCRQVFNIEDDHAAQRPLEVLLPATLEDQWGYHLYLLDRDPLPGEAYTHDVVHGLKISRMLICLLSVDYLSDSNAVFVLESGIQAFLQDSNLRLLLIWTEERPASLGQLDPPLPPLVWRALRVLPALDWASAVSERATSNFWRTLRNAMPVKMQHTSIIQNDQAFMGHQQPSF